MIRKDHYSPLFPVPAVVGTVCSVAFQKAQCCPQGTHLSCTLQGTPGTVYCLRYLVWVGGGVLFLKYEVPCKSSWSHLEILVVRYRCFIVYFQTAVFPFFGVFFFSFSIKSFQKSLTSHPWQSASQKPSGSKSWDTPTSTCYCQPSTGQVAVWRARSAHVPTL